MVRHMLHLKDYTPAEIARIVDKTIEIKRNPQKYSHALDGKSLIMLFQKNSTRTRLSFEIAMTQLGGHAVFVDWRTTQVGMASLADETKVMARYCDAIMARMKAHADMQSMAAASTVPVINGCDEMYHPVQALCDLAIMKEKAGDLKGKKIVYAGIQNNVSNTLLDGATKMGMQVVFVTPEVHEISRDGELIAAAKKTGLYREAAAKDLKKEVADADFVYTDTWVDMELFNDPAFAKEKERRLKVFMPLQINAKLLEGSNARVMHDMPIHEGFEMTRDAIGHANSIIFDQAEGRLHGEKAILLFLLGKM
ncbi:MAG: ornithine carbamoyltransferase [Candidatus Micrarchaeota archaeon]